MKEVKEKLNDVKIVVIGVGGGGGNAVESMIRDGVKGVNYYLVNTDRQALTASRLNPENKICIETKRENPTRGLGAGANPEVGRNAAEENYELIQNIIKGADMVFITAGMGGGTGTGASPIIAKMSKELGILTVGVVTKPFSFEGRKRAMIAEEGIKELKKYCDTLITIPNSNLLLLDSEKKLSFLDAFAIADSALKQGVEGVSNLISTPGLVNLDFADITKIMKDRGSAHVGIGEATGDNRVSKALKTALESPLLETKIQGATGILINVSGGRDLGMMEVNIGCQEIEEYATDDADIIFGTSIDESLEDKVKVTIIATGFDKNNNGLLSFDNINKKNDNFGFLDIPQFLKKENKLK